jgi:hypothetical protein
MEETTEQETENESEEKKPLIVDEQTIRAFSMARGVARGIHTW